MGGTDHGVLSAVVPDDVQQMLLRSRFRAVAYNAIRAGVPADELHSILTAADDAAALAEQADAERPMLRLVDG